MLLNVREIHDDFNGAARRPFPMRRNRLFGHGKIIRVVVAEQPVFVVLMTRFEPQLG
jgi:hypothetical protein